MKAIGLILLTLLVVADKPTVVQLKINYDRWVDNDPFAKVVDKVILKTSGREIQELEADKTGLVEIRMDTIAKYGKLDIFMTSTLMQELYLFTVDKKTIDKLEIDLPRKYIMKDNFAVCPKCHKSDRVMKAIYGLNQSLIMIVKKGDTTYTNKIGRDYYMGSCIKHPLNPLWFCDRDDILF